MKMSEMADALIQKIKTLISEESHKIEMKILEKHHSFEIKIMEKSLSHKPEIVVQEKSVDFDIEKIELMFDEDNRELKISMKQEDGSEKFKSIRIPTMIYRGVYENEKAYEKGDCVTHDGSMWVCKSETSVKPGSEGGEWQLSVKRGQKGKDAKEIRGQ